MSYRTVWGTIITLIACGLTYFIVKQEAVTVPLLILIGIMFITGGISINPRDIKDIFKITIERSPWNN